MPTSAFDAKGMMISAIKDNNPVIFLEHRWLHPIVDEVPESVYEVALDRAKIVSEGSDVTIAAFSYMTVETLIAARALKKLLGISVELIDMRSVSPLDSNMVIDSVKKTGRLIIADTAHRTGSVGAELVSQVLEKAFDSLKDAPIMVCSPDFPAPTSFTMSESYYPNSRVIADKVIGLLKIDSETDVYQELMANLKRKGMHDIPNAEFKGPF
jgi:pyruvate dehydrogenase E1 component beta subunit